MENLIEKLHEIVDEFNSIEAPTNEQINDLKQKEFDLFGEIETIKELCEYYAADMTLDRAPQAFISGMYSGVVNGSMFILNEVLKIIEKEEKDGIKLANRLIDKLKKIEGVEDEE